MCRPCHLTAILAYIFATAYTNVVTCLQNQEITGKRESIVELLAMPDAADIDFEPLRLNNELYRSADLS